MFSLFGEEPYNGMDAMWTLDCLLILHLEIDSLQKSQLHSVQENS